MTLSASHFTEKVNQSNTCHINFFLSKLQYATACYYMMLSLLFSHIIHKYSILLDISVHHNTCSD